MWARLSKGFKKYSSSIFYISCVANKQMLICNHGLFWCINGRLLWLRCMALIKYYEDVSQGNFSVTFPLLNKLLRMRFMADYFVSRKDKCVLCFRKHSSLFLRANQIVIITVSDKNRLILHVFESILYKWHKKKSVFAVFVFFFILRIQNKIFKP